MYQNELSTEKDQGANARCLYFGIFQYICHNMKLANSPGVFMIPYALERLLTVYLSN